MSGGCGAHGACGWNDICVCQEGWSGSSCSFCRLLIIHLESINFIKTLPLKDLGCTAGGCLACQNAGICNSYTGKCECKFGFTGAECATSTNGVVYFNKFQFCFFFF